MVVKDGRFNTIYKKVSDGAPRAALLGVSSEIDQRSVGIRFLSPLVNAEIRIISAAKTRPD